MLKRLLNLGIFPGQSFHQENKLKVFNSACTLVLAIAAFYLVYGLHFHFYVAAIVSVFFIGSIVVSMCMVKMRRYNAAFHVAMICSFIFLGGFTYMFGPGAKAYFYFLFMPVASTLLFDRIGTTVKYMLVSVVYLLLSVAFTEYMLPYYASEYGEGVDLWFFGYPNMIFTVLLIFMGLRVFKAENRKYERQIEEQKQKLEEKNKEMTDSINYARRIQYTLLAHKDFLNSNLPEHFVFFKPKDIVSGDFYWAAKKNGRFYLAVCDSTGHGVPGAFMSLLNISFLNEALNEKNLESPDKILNYVRERLIENVSQEGAKDGMDAILICYDKDNQSVSYAAGNNAPLLIRDRLIINLAKDKMPVGQGEKKDDFALHNLQMKRGDRLYLYTDGFADQFGGPKGKKYKSKQLEQLLLSKCEVPAMQQESAIQQAFDHWRGNLEQVDDVCIVGIKF